MTPSLRNNVARGAALTVALGVLAATAPLASTSCSSTPVNVAVRTFERAQKVDVLCLQVLGPDPNNPGGQIPIQAVPLRQAECAPVPPGVNGTTLPNHLYALVTQTTHGELALVDLTGGYVIDEDRSTPGINFIPVGALPTDVAVAPDGAMSFVSTAEANKPALYGIPSTRVLGDSQWPVSFKLLPPLTLPDLPACSLPQVPIALAILPRASAPAGDAGTGADAGSDAGGDAGAPSFVPQSYEIAAVLAGTGGGRAKIVTIDPVPLLRGGGIDTTAGPKIDPGSLEPCPVTSVLDLGGAVPSSFVAGAPWDDGVKYVDGGVDLRATEPALPAICPSTQGTDGGVPEAGMTDGGSTDAGDAGAFNPLDSPRPTALAFDDQNYILYVADGALPLIHAIDVSTPGMPHELPPLLATSISEPSRTVAVGALAVSPATSDYKRFLYAIDAKQGSLIIYDITAGAAAGRTPLTRPHGELNPFQPVDRIVFNAPVAAVAFVRNDWPLTQVNGQPLTATKTGLLCNPNPNASTDPNSATAYVQTDEGLGASYRANAGIIAVPLGAYRLRGVFAFATLTNGQIVTIDVDDWDAPCRRPDPLGPDKTTGALQPSALAVPEPTAASGDTNPYHAPLSEQLVAGTAQATTSLEAFFPVSAPHRPRSAFFLRNDPSTGLHIPNLAALPQLSLLGAAKSTTGTDGLANPIMLPTATTYADPIYVLNPAEPDPVKRTSTLPPDSPAPLDPKFSLPVTNTTPSVRFAWEDPQVHVEEDWTVTYEGPLPGLDGYEATVEKSPADVAAYESLTLSTPNGLLCRTGIEDARLGHHRVTAELAELRRLGIPPYIDPYKWTGDYVQLADDILPQGDPYWSVHADDNECWNGDPMHPLANPDEKQAVCQSTFGSLSDATPTPFRDFPILEAYGDRLVVGRFGYPDPANPATVNRVIVGRDASNVAALKLMRCCFHRQVKFKVRTGGRWVAVGSAVGYLHHITQSAVDGSCVQSCDPLQQLLNARAPDVPRGTRCAMDADCPTGHACDAASHLCAGVTQPPDRNSPLAVRNPMFSFVMWSGAPPSAPTPQLPAPGHTTSLRDLTWKFSTRGQFIPLTISLSASSTSVSPQSMRFIDSLGQLAVVDGASQGLVLIDLGSVALAHTPYF